MKQTWFTALLVSVIGVSLFSGSAGAVSSSSSTEVVQGIVQSVVQPTEPNGFATNPSTEVSTSTIPTTSEVDSPVVTEVLNNLEVVTTSPVPEAESTVQPIVSPISTTSTALPTIDKSNRTVTDGIHIDVYYPAGKEEQAYIPSFTLELWSVDTKTRISTVTGNAGNYQVAAGKYALIFAHPGYRLGDQLALVLRKAGTGVDSLQFCEQSIDGNGNPFQQEYKVTENTHYSFSIAPFTYTQGDQDEQVIQDLTATMLRPLSATLSAASNKIALALQDGQGGKLANTGVQIELLENKGTLQATSDDEGLVWLDTDKLTWMFLVSPAAPTAGGVSPQSTELELPPEIVTGTAKGITVLPVVWNSGPSVKSGEVKVTVNVSGIPELSTAWKVFTLKLTDKQGTTRVYSVSDSQAVFSGIPAGTYTLEAESAYAKVSSLTQQITVTTDKPTELKLTINPQYTLEISKDGEQFSFSFLNVAGGAKKVYTGTKPQTFAVVPGNSYMVKDTETGTIHTIVIDEQSKQTHVVLGAGVVFGGTATTPHTGDPMLLYILGLTLMLLLSIGLFLLYRKINKKTSSNHSWMSIILIAALGSSVLSASLPSAAYADDGGANVGGTPPATGSGGSATAAGTFQTSDKVAVLQFGFIPNKVKSNGSGVLTASSTATDLQDDFKFNYEPYMFYMAPSKTSDQLFRKNGSGVVTFEEAGTGSKVSTLYGSNPLYPGSAKGTDKAAVLQRTLEHADNAVQATDGNYFKHVIAETLVAMDSGNPDRSLSGEGSASTIGAALKSMLEDYILKHGSDDQWDKLDSQIVSSLMFQGYMDLIRDKGILKGNAYTAYAQMMQEKFSQNEIVLFAQTLVGISVKDNSSPTSRDFAFMSVHDATAWYLHIRQQARPTDTALASLSASREYQAVTKGGASSEAQGASFPYRENGNFPNTYQLYARDYYARTLKPVSSKVALSDNVAINPFGGWGYQPWGYGEGDVTKTPMLDAALQVSIVDDTGKETGVTFTETIEGWSPEDKKVLGNLKSLDSRTLIGSTVFQHNKETYEIVPEEKAKFTLMDVKDKENLNKSDLTTKAVGQPGTFGISEGSSNWSFLLGYATPLPTSLSAYLGGEEDGTALVENKYAGVKENGKAVYSNAQLTLYVKAKVIGDRDPLKVSYEVPEWRLSKYWENIADKGVNQAIFSLSLPSQTFVSPELSPSGQLPFALSVPKLEESSWALSQAKLINDSQIKEVYPAQTLIPFKVAGDLLAIKDNALVSNIMLASWVNPFSLYNERIRSTSEGKVENKPLVTMSQVIQYGVESPTNAFTYSEERYRSSAQYDSKGKYTGTISVPYRFSGLAAISKTTADYQTTVSFKRYIPQLGKGVVTLSDQSKAGNGFYWQTKQAGDTLKVDPEVMMAYSDMAGNTSLAYVAGDVLRDIKPVNYNLARYVNVDVNPSVTGMSVAMDSKAKALASRLGAGSKEVIYKGSATTTNFAVQGQFQLKTFALDIGYTAIKNAWNPSTTYTTDKVNESFLAGYGDKLADGTWEVPLTATGKLKIGGTNYGGQSAQLKATQLSTNVIEHTLTIRGGKLIAVDNQSNLSTLPQELQDALSRMHLSGSDTILNVFESGKGAHLTEPEVAALGNALRGSNDLAVGKGWYNEDTTMLVIREYTTNFKLPSHMYTDKIPMEIPTLAVQIDKNQFFSQGLAGYTLLNFKAKEVQMTFDSSIGGFGGNKSIDYIVPNVSVMDTFGQ